MKKDISETINKIESLCNSIPNDFALQDAKLFLRKAINEMREVHVKRQKRNTLTQQTQQQSYLDYNTAKLALKEIDKLIEMEKKNLEKSTNKPTQDEFLIG